MQPGVPESHHLPPWTGTVTGSAQPFLQTQWYLQRTGAVYPIERTDCEETFFTHSTSEPNNLLNRQTHITANCLMAMVSSGDLGDLPSDQTLPESDSGMFTLLSDGWAADYSGVKDRPLRPWTCSIVYSWINTHQAKKKDSLSLSG